jgi:hypothetical protein
VTSPEGQCLWDPATCVDAPPASDGQCVSLKASLGGDPTSSNSISVSPRQNCPTGGGYTPGTGITLSALGNGFAYWDGTCAGRQNSATISFTITKNCSMTAYFNVG